MTTPATEAGTTDELEDRLPTAPAQFTVSIRGLESVERATELGQLLGQIVRELSRGINLEGLDGITVAVDYGQALADLDRGYSTSHTLTPTDEHGVGVAMTPSVIRNGSIKSHILFNAHFILPLAEPESEGFKLALHLLAHECAHVELTHLFDKCFPGHILRKPIEDMHQGFRWQAINACWGEYGATWISAPIGHDPTDGYEETFALALNAARLKADLSIKAFRLHEDAPRVFAEVYTAYGELMRFACYLLGTMNGRLLTLNDLPRTKNILEGHWFLPFFERLQELLNAVGKGYGTWTTLDDFEAIGDLADELMAQGGLKITGDRFYLDPP